MPLHGVQAAGPGLPDGPRPETRTGVPVVEGVGGPAPDHVIGTGTGTGTTGDDDP